MTYGTLLLHLDDAPHATLRTAFAIELARALGSRLLGLSDAGPPPAEVGFGMDVLPSERLDNALRIQRANAEARAERFERQARDAGLDHVHAWVDDRDDAAALEQHSLRCDLLILPRPAATDPDLRHHRRQFERAVFHCAPPVLILPPADPARPWRLPGGTALVAWNDSREAARSTRAALPLLRRAEAVKVVHFEPEGGHADPALTASLGEVCDWLAHDGVAAELDCCDSREATGPALLSYLASAQADLLVMGAWTHGRVTEQLLFGGASRTVVEGSPIPILMAR